MAARSIWTGSLSFGLVNVPCKLVSATAEKNVRFHQINGVTGARVKQKKVDASTGDEVPYEQIVKGYELSPDRYVTIEPEELAAIAPKKTSRIELEKFVDLADIDPIVYGSSYYIAPDKGGAHSYDLLVQAMGATDKVGIGRVVMRSKEYLAAVRAHGNVLVCSTMKWADEVNDPDRQIDRDEDESRAPTEQELQMANLLIESLSGDFDYDAYQDTYRAQVFDMIERKAAGETIEAPTTSDEAPAAPDLMAALQASLQAQGEKTESKPKAKKATSKKAKVAA